MNSPTLGILGGLGPMSSVYFYEMLTEHTAATADQQHLDILISSRASTPDRTAFILGKSPLDPLPVMETEAQRLQSAGADIIAIPCNTAHCFYEGIRQSVDIPVISIIRMTAEFCLSLGLKKVGLLATEGTVASGAYAQALGELGIECAVCDKEDQATVSEIIYGQIKKGVTPDTDAFLAVADRLYASGCERMILGCTELSLLKRTNGDRLPSTKFIDSLEVLSLCAIRLCEKTPQGFDAELMRFSVPNIYVKTKNSRIVKG